MKSSHTIETFTRLETPLFIIEEKPKGFSVDWQPSVLNILTKPRPLSYFNTVDQVRKNIETTINARCNHESLVDQVNAFVEHSLNNDIMMTPNLMILQHIGVRYG